MCVAHSSRVITQFLYVKFDSHAASNEKQICEVTKLWKKSKHLNGAGETCNSDQEQEIDNSWTWRWIWSVHGKYCQNRYSYIWKGHLLTLTIHQVCDKYSTSIRQWFDKGSTEPLLCWSEVPGETHYQRFLLRYCYLRVNNNNVVPF